MENPAPSVALEYTFARRTRNGGNTKDVCHIWELAGGTRLSDLVNIPIIETNIQNTSIMIVVDLSKVLFGLTTQPGQILALIKHFIDKIGLRVRQVLDGLEQRGSKRPKAMRSHAWIRFGADHPDRDQVIPFPIQLTICASKYDSLADMESYNSC